MVVVVVGEGEGRGLSEEDEDEDEGGKSAERPVVVRGRLPAVVVKAPSSDEERKVPPSR